MFLSFQSKNRVKAAQRLYSEAVAQARRPVFYSMMGVPDTVDGRFDLLSLHVFLIVQRLRVMGRAGRGLSQGVFDRMFIDMDRSVREMGVGDLGVPKHMKRMMKGFNGRCLAYEDGLKDVSGNGLRAALIRNVYGTSLRAEPVKVAALAGYVRDCAVQLASQPDQALLDGKAVFPAGLYDERTDSEHVDAGMVA